MAWCLSMAGAAPLNQLPCKTHIVGAPECRLFRASSLSPVKTATARRRINFSIGGIRKLRLTAVNAAGGGEYAAATTDLEVEPIEIDKLKGALLNLLYGTDRGLKATSQMRAEIVELITKLEAKNPTPSPTDALPLLNGKWILAYTSFSPLFPLLAKGLPLVKVEEISQTIDSENFTVQNSVQFVGPLTTTSLSANAKFEVQSPKRVQIKFEEGIIGTPQLTDSIVVPESMDFFGQKIDLTPLRGILTSVQDTASSVVKSISSRPPLKIPIGNTNAQSWLLTTYLDDELRISRGDAGSIFVLIKEGSSLLIS